MLRGEEPSDVPSMLDAAIARADAALHSLKPPAKADTHAADSADRASGSTTSYGGPPDAGDSDDDDDDAAAPARALRPCPACTFKNPAAAGVCDPTAKGTTNRSNITASTSP